MTVVAPRLTLERRLLKQHPLVIACDEVGRGALAGPVAVGAAVVDATMARRRIPEGLRDSKLVPEHRRPDVATRAAAWVCHSAIGWADAAEIDRIGIIAALGQAAVRAIESLRADGVPVHDALVILDGNHDYITRHTAQHGAETLRVRPIIKADRDCASAAAASVIAKVARDRVMTDLDDPGYQWARNKGYASAEHRDAIRRMGLSPHHRASWAIADAASPPLF